MAKADASKVPYNFGENVVNSGKDLSALYSEAVVQSFRTRGTMVLPFDAKDLVAWVKQYHPELFDAKGKRIK